MHGAELPLPANQPAARAAQPATSPRPVLRLSPCARSDVPEPPVVIVVANVSSGDGMTLDNASDAALLSITDCLDLADLLTLAQTTKGLHRFLISIPEMKRLYELARAASKAGALPSQIEAREEALHRNASAGEAARRVKLIATKLCKLSLLGAASAEISALSIPDDAARYAHLSAAGLGGAAALLGMASFLAWCRAVDLEEGQRAVRLRCDGASAELSDAVAEFADNRRDARQRREDNAARAQQSVLAAPDMPGFATAPT